MDAVPEQQQQRTVQVPKKFRWMVMAIVTLIILGVVVQSLFAPTWLEGIKATQGTTAFIIMGVVYTILLAIPGMPGIEIAILMMILFGETGCLVVYITTIIAFNIAFAVGRWLFRDDSQDPLLSLLEAKSAEKPRLRKMRNLFLRNRYLSVAVLLNLPGNWLLGGGGGISMLCGCSNAFSWTRFAITVAVAAAALPLFGLFGLFQLEFFANLV